MCVVMKMPVCLVASLELVLHGSYTFCIALRPSALIKTSNSDLAQGSDEDYLVGSHWSSPAYCDKAEKYR